MIRASCCHATPAGPRLRGRSGGRTTALFIIAWLICCPCRADILKFDMGPKDSPVWPAFTRVGKDTVYSKETGFGLRTAEGVDDVVRKDGRKLKPDDLCGDMILGATPIKTPYPKKEKLLRAGGEIEFLLDLPNGAYHVRCIMGDSGGQYDSGLPFADFYVKAEGEQKLLTKVGETVRFGRSGAGKEFFYKRVNDVFSPGDDLWEKYVGRVFAPCEFTVDVKDGQLNLVVGNRPLNGLIVYPSAERAQAKRFLAELEQERRKAWAYTEHRRRYDRDMPKITTEDRVRGYAVFTPSCLAPTPYYYVPKQSEMTETVHCFAAKGEFEPVTFAILPQRSLKNCRARVSDFKSERGHTISRNNVDVRIVKHLERPFTRYVARVDGGYYVEPLLLMKWPTVDIEKGVVRQFWLTIHVPDDAKSGRYVGTITIEPEDAHPEIVTVKLLVLPFKLRELTDKLQAIYWYHTGLRLYGDKTIADLRDHGFNVIHTPPAARVKLKDGELDFNFTEVEDALKQFKDCGYPMRLVVSQSESCQVESLTGERSRAPGAHRFRPKYSERHKELTRKVVRRVVEEYRKRGWPELIMYCDGEVEPEAVENAIQHIDLVEEGGGQSSVNFLSWEGFVQAAGHLSVLQFSANAGWPMDEMKEVARKAGRNRLFIYGLGYNRLERGFYFWKTGCQAATIEGYINVYGDPYNEFDGGYITWGYVWPSPDGPVPTTEWEWQREGVDDCRYLSHLTHLIKQAKASGKPGAAAAAAQAEAEIEAMMATIHPEINHYRTGVRAKHLYNWDIRQYDILRWRTAVQILKLRKVHGIEDDPVLARDMLRIKIPQLAGAARRDEGAETDLAALETPDGWQTTGIELLSDSRVRKNATASLALKVKVDYSDRKIWPRMAKALGAMAPLKRYTAIEFWALARTKKKSRAARWRLGLTDDEGKTRYLALRGLKESEWAKVTVPLEPLLVDAKGFSMGKPTQLRLVTYEGHYDDGD